MTCGYESIFHLVAWVGTVFTLLVAGSVIVAVLERNRDAASWVGFALLTVVTILVIVGFWFWIASLVTA